MWSYLQGVCINGALGHEAKITCDQTFLLPFFSRKSHDVKLTNIYLEFSIHTVFCFLAYFGVSAVLTLMWPSSDLPVDGTLPNVFAWRGAPWAKYVIAVGALCGLTSSLLGALLPLPRMLYSMASDGLIFK